MSAVWMRTRAWFVHRKAEAMARDMLAEGGLDAALTACDAMNTLNRFAKHAEEWKRNEIYRLKQSLITELREQFPCTVSRAVHRQLCHTCDGTGIWSRWTDYADTCLKCNGTGIYREHQLVLFAFMVGDIRYAWHQPAENWSALVLPADEPEAYQRPVPSWLALNDLLYHTLSDVVALWIERQALPGMLPRFQSLRESLWRSIRLDVVSAIARARWYARGRVYRLRRAIDSRIARPKGVEEDYDLPF